MEISALRGGLKPDLPAIKALIQVNTKYLVSLQAIVKAAQMVTSLIAYVLLATCAFDLTNCDFLYLMSGMLFLNGVILFLVCFLSKPTADGVIQSLYEGVYNIVFAIMLFGTSVSVMHTMAVLKKNQVVAIGITQGDFVQTLYFTQEDVSKALAASVFGFFGSIATFVHAFISFISIKSEESQQPQ